MKETTCISPLHGYRLPPKQGGFSAELHDGGSAFSQTILWQTEFDMSYRPIKSSS